MPLPSTNALPFAVSAILAGAICANASELAQITAVAAIAANVLDVMAEYLPLVVQTRGVSNNKPRNSNLFPQWRRVAGESHGGNSPAPRWKHSRQGFRRVLRHPRRFGENHATATGSLHSNRAALDPGANGCADRGVSHGRFCGLRSRAGSLDLPRQRGFHGYANATGEHSARSRILLHALRGRSRRRRVAQSAAVHFCKPAAPLPTRLMAGAY